MESCNLTEAFDFLHNSKPLYQEFYSEVRNIYMTHDTLKLNKRKLSSGEYTQPPRTQEITREK